MAYGAKYKFKFVDTYGVTFEVRLLEKDYTGSVTWRPLGGSPVLRMQQSGPFRCTSCDLTLECQVDGEFAFLYTSDPQEYKIVVYRESAVIWQGFVATELYSEPDIAPPYDVRVTATDGLGVLKEYDYVPYGAARRVREQIQGLLAKTGLSMDLNCIFSIHEHGDTTVNFLDETFIDLDYMDGKSCYEALEELLNTFHCVLTQWRDDWALIRESDVTVQSNGDVSMINCDSRGINTPHNQTFDEMTAVVGQRGVAQMWPVGYLTRSVVPAKKSITVISKWHTKNGFPEVKNDGWSTSNYATFDSTYKYYHLGTSSYVYEQSYGILAASVVLNKFTKSFKVVVKANNYVAYESSIIGVDPKVKILAAWTNLTTQQVYYYSPGRGWSTSYGADGDELEIRTMNPNHDINLCQEVSAEFPALEDNSVGWFSLNIKGIHVDVYSIEVFPSDELGFQDTIVIDNGARGKAGSVEISGGREMASNLLEINFLRGVFYTELSGQGYSGIHIITSFDDADNSQLDFMSLMALNYAKTYAAPRIQINGKIDFPSSRSFQPVFIKSHGVWALMESYDWNLKEAEISFKAVTLPTATLTVDSETITSIPNN